MTKSRILSTLVLLISTSAISVALYWSMTLRDITRTGRQRVQQSYAQAGRGPNVVVQDQWDRGTTASQVSFDQRTRSSDDEEKEADVGFCDRNMKRRRKWERKAFWMETPPMGCKEFKAQRRYVTLPLSKEEAKFPLAYAILVYKDAEQVEMLLRAIYRPQNFYCLHVDQSSRPEFLQAISELSKCFDNVFVSSTRVDVTWGKISVVDAHLICMRDLLGINSKWKYLLTLTGHEFPLKTNAELVKILNVYNGLNDIASVNDRKSMEDLAQRIKNLKSPPPFNLSLSKGSLHATMSRSFVEFLSYNRVSKAFLGWLRRGFFVPDESFWQTINSNPHIHPPGGSMQPRNSSRSSKLSANRKKQWIFDDSGKFSWKTFYPSANSSRCHGVVVRSICVFGTGDLPTLLSDPAMFANKFHVDFPSSCLALRRLDRWLMSRSQNPQDFPHIDLTYYKRMMRHWIPF